MRKWLIALIALCVCFTGCAASEDDENAIACGFEIFMINVGKGDAIIVRAEEKTYLIDAGYAYVWGRVYGALQALGISKLDGVFLTHTDKDHAGGIMPLALSDIEVGAWYASGCSMEYKETKHPMTLAAAARGQKVNWLYAGDEVDGLFSVLAPTYLFEDKEDNNSLVMMLNTPCGKALLTGDMEFPEERVLLATDASLACDVLKVANHADGDATSSQLMERVGAKLALISTDPYEKVGTPDPVLVEKLKAAGMRVMRTDMSEMGIHVVANESGVTAEYVPEPMRPGKVQGVSVGYLSAEADLIKLTNDTGADVDISGWYLYSTRGDEFLCFPSGSTLPASGLLIGTRSSEVGAQYLWDDKNVVNDKKEDTIALYDVYGREVSSMSNGL